MDEAESQDTRPVRVGGSALFVIILTVFVDLIGFGIIIPLLPFYAQELGAGPTALGLLLASFSFMAFVFAPILGRLSDRYGRRPILLLSLVGSTTGHLIFALADSLLLLLLSRIIAGTAAASLSVAQAYIADTTTPKERARGMGLIGASFGVGVIVGPVIGGSLIGYGFSAPGFAAAAIAFSNLLLALSLLPESLPPSLRARHRILPRRPSGFIEGFRRPIIGPLLITVFVIFFSFATIPVVYPLFGIELFDLGPRDMSLIFIYIGAVQVVIQAGMIGRLVRWVGEERLLVSGTLLMTVTIFAVPLIPELTAFLILTGLISAGIAIASPVILSMISTRSSPSEQGKMLGLSQSVAALARIPGPLSAGLIFEYLGVAAPFVISAVMMLLGFALSLRILRQRGGISNETEVGPAEQPTDFPMRRQEELSSQPLGEENDSEAEG
ncbi:MAG: MFS transporter [Candidatus Geothermarchaeales archaeon]